MTKPAGTKIRLKALGHRAVERSLLHSCRSGTEPVAGPTGAFTFGCPACLLLPLPLKLGHSYLSVSLIQEGKARESQPGSVEGLPAAGGGVGGGQGQPGHQGPPPPRRRGGTGGCPC